MRTKLSISGENFLLNGRLTYSELPGSNHKMHGLLMNARFIQGIFDDKADPRRFDRFGKVFDPEKNTDDLIAALPKWYAMGMRAITVGLQGGGPCFTVANGDIVNTPFSTDGTQMDPAYLRRLTRLLNAADAIGMAVIVSALYCGQIRHLDGARGVLNAITSACRFLREGGWKNLIFEPANEYDISLFQDYPLVNTHQGMVALLELARKESGLPVGCSGGGGSLNREVAQASDVILFHGNGQTRQDMVRCIRNARQWAPGKPIVCNEDSPAVSNLQVCMDHHVSWGYYNALSKQELATDWGILPGEDTFFALRMAENIGIPVTMPCEKEALRLMGLTKDECWNGRCWPRVAALYPEKINFVDFFLNGEHLFRSYEDPFSLYYRSNWIHDPLYATEGILEARVTFRTGEQRLLTGAIGADAP